MRLKPITSFCAAIVFCGTLKATVPGGSGNNYGVIPERNVFGLKQPQAIKETPAQPQLPKIILTGITTILGNKRALMKTQPTHAKPGQHEPEKEQSFILTEGQREGDIEVLQIDEKAGSVKVNNSGTVMTLTFEKDGAKLPATPALTSAVPGLASIPLPVPTNRFVFSNTPGMHPLPTRYSRSPALPSGTGIPGQGAAVQSPIGGIPSPTGVVPAPNGSQPSELTAEEQAILQQIQREAATPVTPALSNVPAPGSVTAPPVLPQ